MIVLKENEKVASNVTRSESGELLFANVKLSQLAEKYGTPLYLYDEERIREKCRAYKAAIKDAFGDYGQVLYASKAASFKRLYEIMKEEDMGIDVVSRGEIYTAIKAGFDLSRAYFHSNNKTDCDIEYAIDNGVGYFVVDNREELFAIDRIAGEKNIKQKLLLRLTPGIDPHTYAAVATGKVDSKFGSAIETGQAKDMVGIALSLKNLDLCGYHCHVGSQLFDSEVYLRTAKVMLDFVKEMIDEYGFTAREVDLGGGFGVRYIAEQPTLDIRTTILQIGEYIINKVNELSIPMPKFSFEPGRSIVADGGLTLYTVGTVKRIPGYKTYLSVDGGMADNPRFALYGSPYTILPVAAEVPEDNERMSVVGRCCESGDILQENLPMPKDIKRGDLLACLTTGAYHYSMASNYNRLPKPPIVMLYRGEDYLAVKGESLDDLVRLDI